MPKKTLNQKEIQTWEGKIGAGKVLFEPVKNQIDKNLRYYRGNQWDGSNNAYKEKTVDNMVFSNVNTLKPSINFSNPKIFVKARKKPYLDDNEVFVDTTATAFLVEMLANYYYKELKIKHTADKVLTDALLMPWGIHFIGFMREVEKVKPSGELLETNELIKSESPYVVRVDPRDLLVDPRAKDSHLQDAEWVACKWTARLEDLKANPKFKNTETLKSNFQASLGVEKGLIGPSTFNLTQGIKEEIELVEGWRIFDKKNQKEINLVIGHNKLLSYEDWAFEYDDGFPIETLYFNENPNELYPITDPEIYLAAQDELNRLRSLQLTHVKSVSERKYKTGEDSMDDAEILKFQTGGDGTIAKTKEDPHSALIPVSDATSSQDLYLAIRHLQDSIREQSSVSAAENAVSRNLDTATESALIAQGVKIKREFRTAAFENFLIRTVRKLLMIVQQADIKEISFPLSEEQFKEAQNPENRIASKLSKLKGIVNEEEVEILSPWLSFSSEEIKGDFEFDIEIGSTRPTNQEVRKQEVLQLAELFSGDPEIDSLEAKKRIFEAFEVHDYEKLLKDPEVVAQEAQASQEAQIEAEKEVDRQAKEVDLMKTEMKTETQKIVTEMKGRIDVLTALIKEQGKASEVKIPEVEREP